MGHRSKQLAWKLVSAGAAVAAGVLARKAAVATWRAVTHSEPPDHPESRQIDWRDAVLWSAGIGVAASLSNVIGRRGAARGWERVTGEQPPI